MRKTDNCNRQFYQFGAFFRVTNINFRKRYCRETPPVRPWRAQRAPKTREILLKREKRRGKRGNIEEMLLSYLKLKLNILKVTRLLGFLSWDRIVLQNDGQGKKDGKLS